MSMTTETRPLAGISVLVTRPRDQAAALGTRIKQYGGKAIIFPAIEITPPHDADAMLSVLGNLAQVDLMIFVSVHAVHGVTELLRQHRLQIPPTVRIAAVGPKTELQCEQAGLRVDFAARLHIHSEGLLDELRSFEVAGKNILIFRGQDGREWLKQTLESRGAQVRYVESYQRKVTDRPVTELLQHWHRNEIDLVLVSSGAVLDALRQILGRQNQALLEKTPILAYSQRLAAECRKAGMIAEILVAEKPTDESAVKTIIAWHIR